MEDIIDSNYNLSTRIRKDFEVKKLEECHNFYLKNDILLLADGFENLIKMCLEILKEIRKSSFGSSIGFRSIFENTKMKL